MTSERLLRHSIPLHVANGVVLLLNALYQRLMGQTLSPEEFGVLQTLNSALSLLVLPFTAVSSGLTHFMARGLAEGRPGAVRALLWRWLARMALAGLAVIAVGGWVSAPVAEYFHFHRAEPVRLAALLMALTMLGAVLASPHQAVQAFTWISVAMVVQSLGRLVFGWLLTRTAFPTAGWAMLGAAFGVGLSLVLYAALLPRLLPRAAAPHPEDARAPVVAYVGWSIPVLIAYTALFSADTMAVKRLFPAREAGYYAQFALLARLAVFFPLPFCRALFPKVVSGGSTSPAQRRTWIKAVLATLAFMAPVAGALLLAPGLVFSLIFPGAPLTPEWRALLPPLALATAANGLLHILLTFETAQHRFRTLWPVCAAAILYVAGISAFAGDLLAATRFYCACNVLACAGVLLGVLRALGRTAPADPIPPSP
jgi:O-antigen/teichoic acid export membrane protein